MSKIKVCLVGSAGKMGQALLAELKNDKDFGTVVTVSRQHEADHRGIFAVKPVKVDVVLNFTTPVATLETAQFCAENKLPLVTGTTGLNHKQMAKLGEYAQSAPILWSPNMLREVNFIEMMLPHLAKILPSADIEIVEQHHRAKEDSPSGTAMFFAQAISKATGKKIICSRPKGNSVRGRTDEIYIHSLRGGNVDGGMNEVRFLGDQEEIIISHRAFSSSAYASDALMAAKWLINQKPGLYSMKDLMPKLG